MAWSRRCYLNAAGAEWRISVMPRLTKSTSPVSRSTSVAGPGHRASPSIQAALTHVHQEPVNLIECQHGGRRIVDGRRQSLVGNVHHDAKGKARVLLHRVLGAYGDTGTQNAGIDGPAAPYAKQRITPGYKIAHLWHQFNHRFRTLRQRLQVYPAERQDNARTPDCSTTTTSASGAGDQPDGFSAGSNIWG